MQLDEEVEGMQSTIMKLQGQLRDAKQQLAEEQQTACQARGTIDTSRLPPRHSVANDGEQVEEDRMETDWTSPLPAGGQSPHRTNESIPNTNMHKLINEPPAGRGSDSDVMLESCEVVVDCLAVADPIERTESNNNDDVDNNGDNHDEHCTTASNKRNNVEPDDDPSNNIEKSP